MKYSLLKYLFILFIVGCTSDIALHEQKKDHVVVDSFVQPYQVTQLDVLVVVDTSGSMNDNFESVGTGIDALRMDIEYLTLDYQFGFITTDANNLSFIGPYTSSSNAIDVMLAPSLLTSAAGEAGFESTYVFYNDEISSSFFRDDSDFFIIF